MTVANNSTARDLEKEKFVDDPNGKTAVRTLSTVIVDTSASTIGTTTLKTDLTTSEFEITAVPNQEDIVITSLTSGRVHYSLNTGVDTTYAFISKNDQLVVPNYSGSVFVILSTGTGTIQIDQRSS